MARLAGPLSRRGVLAGDRVATLMMNRLEVVETYLAASRLGTICVPMNFRLVAEEVAYILKGSGARTLVVDELMAGLGRVGRRRQATGAPAS